MLDDYYSHHPTVSLERPLILTGRFHSDTRRVAHFLAGQTGLLLLDVDDAVAHQLGQSIVALRARDGQRAYLTEEAAALRRLSRQRPAGIIRVGQDCFLERGVFSTVRKHCSIYYIARPEDFEGDIPAPPTAAPRPWDRSLRWLSSVLKPRLSDVATRLIDGEDRHALSIARQIAAELRDG